MAIKFTWINSGFQDILCCDGTMSQVQAATEKIKSKANANNTRGGNGFNSGTRLGQAFGSRRAMGFVYTTDRKSMIAEAEDKALSKAVGG